MVEAEETLQEEWGGTIIERWSQVMLKMCTKDGGSRMCDVVSLINETLVEELSKMSIPSNDGSLELFFRFLLGITNSVQ